MLASDSLTGGFVEPVFEAQSVFRALMDGFSRPGQVASAKTNVQAPAPFGKAAASILLALCDFETDIWLSKSLVNPQVCNWIHFHSGAPLAKSEDAARFAFAAANTELPEICSFSIGTDEYPDTSSTVILEVEALEGGPELVLEGPGINGSATFAPVGLPADFIRQWEQNGTLFPCGIDLVLTAADRFVCLPRTTRIREA